MFGIFDNRLGGISRMNEEVVEDEAENISHFV